MKANAIPTKFNIPFGKNAGVGFIRPIPQASQIGVNDGFAPLNDGSPPLNFLPLGAGGVPPFGQDMNGILNQISAWCQWQNAGGAVPYDATFQAQIGGYPYGAIVESVAAPGTFFICTVDDNASNPDSAGAGWSPWPSTAAVVAAGGLANVQMFTTTTRVSMSGVSGNSWAVTPWSGTYVKQTAASRMIAWLAAPTYTPSGAGCATATLTIGGTSLQQTASNNTAADSRGQTVVNGLYPAVAAGNVAFSLTYARFDSTNWTTVFDPTSADNAYLPASMAASLIIGEIK